MIPAPSVPFCVVMLAAGWGVVWDLRRRHMTSGHEAVLVVAATILFLASLL
jgi:hypothetical protein